MSVEINKVGVVGCGTMGSGICEVVARSGYDVVFAEMDEEAERAGRERIERSVARAVKRGKLDQGAAHDLLGHISSTTDLAGLGDCDLAFEAVPEKLELKKQTFAALDQVLKPEAILATNTSSLPVIDMAVATNRPDRVVGFHFFNPATVMKLVELVHTVATDEKVVESAKQFALGLGKVAVPCRDRAGFIANLLLFPYLNAATRMYDQGYALREDIDAAMQLGCGHPMGPLALLDLIGLDSAYEICEALWRQWRDYADAPQPLLKQFVTAGYLAEVIAKAGGEVVLRGRSETAIDNAKTALTKSLERAVSKAKLEDTDASLALARVSTTLDFEDFAECDLVIEAVAEDLEVKSAIFGELDDATKPDAVLATTTSSLSVVDLAAATTRPDKVIGLHFFNPPAVMKLVEVVRTVATSDHVEERCSAWVRTLGKRPVRCRDRAGFVVNFLLFPYLNDAVHMHEEGYGTPADIDAAMKLGCGHPMGPFELLDIVGLDVTYAILESLHEEFRERRYAPAPLLEHMVRAGYLGRKSGRGFYDYSE